MLTNLRGWVRRLVSPGAPPNQTQVPDAAQKTRESRASLVVGLQAEVRKLQQDIADLNRGWEDGTDQSEREVAMARLRALEHALGQKQEELAKLQGRI
jgi:predicted  nucleic acid-binding Zn-ribbon protein